MNSLKIQDKDKLSTEQHNLKYTYTVDIGEEVFGKPVTVIQPCNLNIFITEICPFDCYFCINHMKNKEISKEDGDIYDNSIHTEDNKYLEILESWLQKFSKYPNVFETTITGGEPLVKPHLLINVMELCNKYGVKPRTFSTTGLNLLKEIDGYPMIYYLKKYGFTKNLNVSYDHYYKPLCGWTYGKNVKHPLSDDDLAKLSRYCEVNDIDLRLSVVLADRKIERYDDDGKLIKGESIGSGKDDIVNYVLYHYNKNRIHNMIFREMSGNFNGKVIIDDGFFFDDIIMKYDFHFIETVKGRLYDIDVYEFLNFIVKHYKEKHIPDNLHGNVYFKNLKMYI